MLTEWKRQGNLIHPVVIDHVTTDMKLAWEEQFGPVVPFMRISDVDAAVEHCNASRLALQGCVFTRDINQAIKISDKMKTGTVQVRLGHGEAPLHCLCPESGLQMLYIG
jgi:glyceraldehyde-3-phosphate dehydrogenase (NADP+)